MAMIRKKLATKPGLPARAMALSSPGKGKPAGKKPGEKPAAKPAPKTVVKSSAKPLAKPAAPAAPKAPKAPKSPPPLNKGALAAKAMAEARAAAKAAEEAKRPRRLVPATANAIRPGSSRQSPAKGKAAPKPPAEVRPLGVLPPESMARPKPAPALPRVAPPARPVPPPSRSATPVRGAARGDDRLTDADMQHFEQLLLEHRARITREMGHIETTILKVNPRDSAGEVGGYSFHMADAGTDSMEREISFDIASKEGRLLREIDDALRRIYNGVYGICEASGKPIARARLEALPWARYTIEEQANMERQQRAGRQVKDEE